MASASSTTSNLSRESHPITPVVSVVMPTYNGERFLRPAIESILSQCCRNFELLVVDDGSTDRTPSILREFAARDDRVIVLTNLRNLGIATATNRGLAAARGEYVALQDHDDISLPHRFQTQLDFLRSHPDVAAVGSAATLIDENGDAYAEFPLPCEEIDIKWRLLFWGDAFHYTSIMVKRSALLEIGGYDEDPAFRFSEAYDPFSRLAMQYHVTNVPESLVLWRRHVDATSLQRQQEQMRSGDIISARNISLLGDLGPASDGNLQRCIRGLRAFTSTPAGRLPTLPAKQVVCGLVFLCKLQKRFYRVHGFSRSAVARHRRMLNWFWGKHAIALSLRAPWELRDRLSLFAWGVRCLGDWAWYALLSGASSGSSMHPKFTVPTITFFAPPSEHSTWSEGH
ncbi:MAG: glycosyltransferase family A protein [Candidatus Korobacteraceae bacterium]|jgi:hypothetical protein